MKIAWVSMAFLAAIAAVEATAVFAGPGARASIVELLDFNPGGALAGEAASALGAAGHVLAHDGQIHFALNAAFIVVVAPWVERRLGARGAAALLLAGALAAAAGHAAWQAGAALMAERLAPFHVGLVGASGPVFALLGAELRDRTRRLARAPAAGSARVARRLIWTVAGGVVAISLLTALVDPHIAAAAHIGAFFAGLWFGTASERLA